MYNSIYNMKQKFFGSNHSQLKDVKQVLPHLSSNQDNMDSTNNQDNPSNTSNDRDSEIENENDTNGSGSTTKNDFEFFGNGYIIKSNRKEDVNKMVSAIQKCDPQFTFQIRDWQWDRMIGISELFIEAAVKKSHILFKIIDIRMDQHEHVVVDTEDAGCVCMHIYYPSLEKRKDPTTPVIVLFTSLTSTQNDYLYTAMYITRKLGWNAVIFNRRGLCEKLKTPIFAVPGIDSDTDLLFRTLMAKPYFTSRRVYAIGFSMGGNQLVRYVTTYAENRKMDNICAIATVCSPMSWHDVYSDDSFIENSILYVLKETYITPYTALFEKDSLSSESRTTYLSEQEIKEHESKMKRFRDIYKSMEKCEDMQEFILLHYRLHGIEINLGTQLGGAEGSSENIFKRIRSFEPSIWEKYKEWDASDRLQSLNIPYFAIYSKDDNLVKLSEHSKNKFMQSKMTTITLTEGGNHCLYQKKWLNFGIEQATSWAENVVFKLFSEMQNQFKNSTNSTKGNT